MVAGGKKKCGTIDKEYFASPTAALESVIQTSKIDAEEGIYAAIIGIPNTLTQKIIEDEEDKVIIFTRGNIAELLTMTASYIYHKYITVEKKGENVIYVKALNAIYGIMKAEILF